MDFGINSIHYFTEALFCPTPLLWRHHIMSGWCRNHRNHGNLLSTDHTENTDFLMSHRNHENLKSLTKIFSVSSVCSVDYFLTMMRKVVPWWGRWLWRRCVPCHYEAGIYGLSWKSIKLLHNRKKCFKSSEFLRIFLYFCSVRVLFISKSNTK